MKNFERVVSMGQAQKNPLLLLSNDWAEHARGAESSGMINWKNTVQHCAQEEKETGFL